MSYQLGIDFGTTNLSAAVRRSDGPPQPVALRGDSALVPAALHLGRDGRVTVGDGALRLAGIDAGRVVRGVKQRVGDPAPVVLGGAEWTAEAVAARLIGWVVERVAEHEGGPATAVVVTHPATWTPRTLQRLAAALEGDGVVATFLPEPVAAGLAAGVDDPAVVYDLGGGRCDVTVLRRTAAAPGLTVVGRPESVVDGSGLDLDELVAAYVCTAAEGAALDAATRRACLRAKETLSTRDEVVVRAGRGEGRTAVRLDRAGFEDLVAPAVTATLAALRRAVASADLDAGAPLTLLLIGGGARIPLVARMVADELGRPVTVVDEPELLVARGAALTELPVADGHEVAVPDAGAPDPVPPTVELAVPAHPAPEPADVPAPAAPPPVEPELAAVTPAVPAPAAPPRPPAVLGGPVGGGRRRSLSRVLAGVGAVAAAAFAVVALFRPDGPLDPPTEVAGPGVVQVTGPANVPGPVTGAGAVAPVPGAPGLRIRALTDQITLAPSAVPPDEPVGPPAGVAAPPAHGPRATGPAPSRPRAGGPVRVAAAPRTDPTPAVDPYHD